MRRVNWFPEGIIRDLGVGGKGWSDGSDGGAFSIFGNGVWDGVRRRVL